MRGIVSNATPLVYLARVNKISLLKRLFGIVYVPKEVEVEVVEKGKELGKKDVYIVEKAIKEGWIKVLRTRKVEVPIELHPGEVAVLSLAKNIGLREVLVDEVPARVAARLLGLVPRETLFILLGALKVGEIDLNDFLEILNELIGQGFRLREEVYLEAIRRARKIAGT